MNIVNVKPFSDIYYLLIKKIAPTIPKFRRN